ncbi:MAG TPA: hypothetical protein VNU97_03570 [Rhizomicrobium sp.]|jgi:endonuclease-3|nr:hypothetical protein [Rhizomicrobium sp.]
MQIALDFGQTETLLSARNRLLRLYEPVPYEGLFNPTDRLIRAFLGSRTRDEIATAAFVRLRRQYGSAAVLAEATPNDVEALIAGVEFADKKAVDMVFALRRLKALSGDFSLEFLQDWSVADALRYLESFHGVGRKIAAAVLNFSTLRKPAFVIDTHVLRVLVRLGFLPPRAKTAETAYDLLMPSLAGWPAAELYEFHWLLKQLGQELCEFWRTQCRSCPLEPLCPKRGLRTWH